MRRTDCRDERDRRCRPAAAGPHWRWLERRLTNERRIRITAPAIRAGATALEKHQHPIRRGAPDEEAVVLVQRAAGLAARSQCVPAVLQFSERGKLRRRRLQCCQRGAGHEHRQQQCSACYRLLLAHIHGLILQSRGGINSPGFPFGLSRIDALIHPASWAWAEHLRGRPDWSLLHGERTSVAGAAGTE